MLGWCDDLARSPGAARDPFLSVKEAREPEACATCHMGLDHPQSEMWSTSKHGVRHQLKRDGVLPENPSYAYPFPDLLSFHDAPTPIENRLFTMHLKHRMRAFQGSFHANPDYALWYGWSEMVQDLTEIRQMAKELREARE